MCTQIARLVVFGFMLFTFSASAVAQKLINYRAVVEQLHISLKSRGYYDSTEAVQFLKEQLEIDPDYCNFKYSKEASAEDADLCFQWVKTMIASAIKLQKETDPHARYNIQPVEYFSPNHVTTTFTSGVVHLNYRKVLFGDSALLMQMLEQSCGNTNCPEAIELIVLDLRGNTGGFLEAARNVGDLFIDGGILHYKTTTTHAEPELRVYMGTNNNYWLEEVPLVLITDKTTVSSAELLTSMLVVNGRLLAHIGERTHGKDLWQRIYEIDFDYTISYRFTQGELLSPKRERYHPGIEPADSCTIYPTSVHMDRACEIYNNSISEQQEAADADL
jgi:hypothetical protein